MEGATGSLSLGTKPGRLDCRSMKWLVGVVAALLLCLVVYAGSAFVSALDLVSAVRRGDASQVMARTDLPRVRHSLVDQVVSAYLDRLGQKRPVRPLERMAINAFGATIADDLTIKLVTPENLSVLLKSGTVRNAAENITFGTMSSLAELDISNIFVFAGRITLAKPVEFALRLGESQDAGSVSMHLDGTTWKLSGIGLPPKVLANMIDRLPTQ
ncbi:DUF2939 domain-containing protein [Bradyrhizobium ottawaense]|nr:MULTISPECIES: DUF2939 domain-containing protein [Bradyrhizobium]WLB44719.1 DUF2939 domain-containing protein [Bradyrhizobium ottawaense]WQN82016.1 DUF2939 domain-containing protein [Bradyrhizobium ottawaense]BBO03363.1 hypothetical protein SG09_27130 [Bradyrhizobium ottawaense]GMO10767.1 hypothetical protein BwSH12_76780 [Bradyrhizobium ottawaense]GMO54127.1 hypothetical protein BwSF12_66570 [Bradyrhizobium ottawaense]